MKKAVWLVVVAILLVGAAGVSFAQEFYRRFPERDSHR